jgi:hypothetical protein
MRATGSVTLNSSAKIQAGVAVGLAVVLWAAWSAFGTPVRIRWLVARGAPPATEEASLSSAEAIRGMGVAARPSLLAVLRDDSSSRARKSWVASLLLRSPFFAQPAVEEALASPHGPTARAAAFALLDGDEAESFEMAAIRAGSGKEVRARTAPLVPWDPAPAVPVLVEWLADHADREARLAARLLGKVPPGDPRVKEALLKAVEEVPSIFAPGAAEDLAARKFLVVDCIQALLAWAPQDVDVVARVSKMVAWIEANGHSEDAWDLQAYGMKLFELSRGRGVDPALLTGLARSRIVVVRQKLANTLETIPGTAAREILRDLLGDESYAVRRSAVLTLMRRKDLLVLEEAPYLIEDSYPYVRVDTLRAAGELRGIAPDGGKAMLPILVSCLEDPLPGVAPTTFVTLWEGSKADIVERAALSLQQIAQRCPGFEGDAIFDQRKREATAKALAEDAAKRRAVVEEWRKTVPARPESNRIAPLVRRLEDRDFENVLRAVRELVRLTGDATGFPPASLQVTTDDTPARNALRDARKGPDWAKTMEHWKAVAAPK